MDFRKCYQILGVAPDCTWDELRIAYRRQVQKHHPDRYQQQPDKQHTAKERMLELNKAYETLAEYYKKNGYLPATALKNTTTNTGAQPRKDAAPNKTTDIPPEIKPAKPEHTSRKTSWGVVLIVTILGYYFFWQTTPDPTTSYSTSSSGSPYYEGNSIAGNGPRIGSSPTQLPDELNSKRIETGPGVDQQATPSNNLAPLGMQGKIKDGPFFTYGDTPGKVFEVQGIPTRTVGDIWFYGTSEVHFNKGVVVSWYNSPAHPLKAK